MIVDNVLPKISWLKKGLKWSKNQSYYFLLKHHFKHCFLMFFQVSSIINDYFLFLFLDATIGNNFFLTLSDDDDDRRRSFAQVYCRETPPTFYLVVTGNPVKVLPLSWNLHLNWKYNKVQLSRFKTLTQSNVLKTLDKAILIKIKIF